MTDLHFTTFASVSVVIVVGVVIALAGVVLVAIGIRHRQENSFILGILRIVNLGYARVVHGIRPGDDPLPETGPALLVSNHRSGVDPLVIYAHTRRIVRFMMAREYYMIPLLRWIFEAVNAIPVNRDGHDFTATKRALRALHNGEVVGIFPEGRIRHLDPEVTFTSFDDGDNTDTVKHGAALLALRANVPIIPVYIDGTPTSESVIRALFSFSRSRVAFGEPLHLESPGSKSSRGHLEEATQRIIGAIATLKSECNAEKSLTRTKVG